jgi:uncharacterized protein (TIGR01244 family)
MLVASELKAGFSVSGQITAADLRELARQGVRTIINNRLDGEDPVQLHSAQVTRLTQDLGPTYRHLPVTLSGIIAEDGKVFDAVVDASPGPVHAYCRSGARGSNLRILSLLALGRMTEAQAQPWGAARQIDIGAASTADQQAGWCQ